MPVAPEILPILIGLWFGYVVYIFCENDDNFVRKRLVKTGNKKKIRSLYLVFAEALKPFTLKNGGWPTIRCSSDAPSATAFFKKLLMEISSVIFFAFISFL